MGARWVPRAFLGARWVPRQGRQGPCPAASRTPPLTPSGASEPRFQIDDRLGRRPRNGRRPRRQPQTIQDRPGRFRRVDRSEDAHPTAAFRTLQHVHLEYAAHQICPGVVARPRPWESTFDRHGSIPCVPAFLRSFSWECAWFHFDRPRYDSRPVPSGWGQDAVVPNEVGAGGRNESGQLLHELERFERDVGGTVAPAMPQLVQQATIL